MQFFNLVPQGNRPLEVKVLGRILHLLLELDDHIGDLGLGHMFCILDIDLFFLDRFSDRLRGDMVLRVERHLQVAPPFCLGNRPLHGIGHDIGIEHDLGVHIPGCPPDDLDQAPCIAEETFLVGIEDPDEPDLGDIEPFPQEIDPDKHIELAEPELADDLAPLKGLDLGVEVAGPDPPVGKELREFLGQFLGQRGDEDAVAPGRSSPSPHGSHHPSGPRLAGPRLRVHKPGRADDLLDRCAGLLQLVLAGCCRDKDHVSHVLFELVEPQRAVVVRAREPETIIDQGLLSANGRRCTCRGAGESSGGSHR